MLTHKVSNLLGKIMLNDKAIVQVCLMAKQTEEKISQDLEEIKKQLKGIYPLSYTICNEINELKELVDNLSIKIKIFTSNYAYEGYKVLSGENNQKQEIEEDNVPF